MNENEALLLRLVCRLFWLITFVPGVARYASDVRLFVEAEKLISPLEKHAGLEELAQGYEREEAKRNKR